MADETTGLGSYNPADYYSQAFQDQKKTAETSTTGTSQRTAGDEEVDFNALIEQNPELKEVFDRLAGAVDEIDDKSKAFSMNDLMQALIELSQILQLMATANAARLSIDTKLMNAYSDQMASIPVVTSDDIKFSSNESTDTAKRSTFNQQLGNAIEIIRANKGKVEDNAKRVQTLMQSSKDAGESIKDFLGSFIDLLRGISQKINR